MNTNNYVNTPAQWSSRTRAMPPRPQGWCVPPQVAQQIQAQQMELMDLHQHCERLVEELQGCYFQMNDKDEEFNIQATMVSQAKEIQTCLAQRLWRSEAALADTERELAQVKRSQAQPRSDLIAKAHAHLKKQALKNQARVCSLEGQLEAANATIARARRQRESANRLPLPRSLQPGSSLYAPSREAVLTQLFQLPQLPPLPPSISEEPAAPISAYNVGINTVAHLFRQRDPASEFRRPSPSPSDGYSSDCSLVIIDSDDDGDDGDDGLVIESNDEQDERLEAIRAGA